MEQVAFFNLDAQEVFSISKAFLSIQAVLSFLHCRLREPDVEQCHVGCKLLRDSSKLTNHYRQSLSIRYPCSFSFIQVLLLSNLVVFLSTLIFPGTAVSIIPCFLIFFFISTLSVLLTSITISV